MRLPQVKVTLCLGPTVMGTIVVLVILQTCKIDAFSHKHSRAKDVSTATNNFIGNLDLILSCRSEYHWEYCLVPNKYCLLGVTSNNPPYSCNTTAAAAFSPHVLTLSHHTTAVVALQQ